MYPSVSRSIRGPSSILLKILLKSVIPTVAPLLLFSMRNLRRGVEGPRTVVFGHSATGNSYEIKVGPLRSLHQETAGLGRKQNPRRPSIKSSFWRPSIVTSISGENALHLYGRAQSLGVPPLRASDLRAEHIHVALRSG